MNGRDWAALAGFVIVCFSAAGLGALATTPELDGWYATLAKPWWNPPGWVFGPVWSTLYLMMAVAGWLVWRTRSTGSVALPLALFVVQLVLNVAWSWVFFGAHQPGWAAVEIVVLWTAIAATLVTFARRSRVTGGLLVPYLLWVTFAAALNVAIWRLNS